MIPQKYSNPGDGLCFSMLLTSLLLNVKSWKIKITFNANHVHTNTQLSLCFNYSLTFAEKKKKKSRQQSTYSKH